MLLVKLANKLLYGRHHLIFSPEFKDSLVALLVGIITHANGSVVRIMRVKRVSQEVQPFHHHEFHRFVEIHVNVLVLIHTLASLIFTVE